MKKSFLIAVSCVLFSVLGCSMVQGGEGHLKGREIVEKGEAVTIKGTLKENGEEWAVVAGDKTYNVHFGKEDYREEQGVKLEEGKAVTIEGKIVGNDVAVCVLNMDGKTTRFRKKDGRPMWAGRGHGKGGKGEGKGKGKGEKGGCGESDCDK
jgi:hypothetical protein